MKFWKILRKLLDEIFPEWQDKFISYKDLKQRLKSIYPSTNCDGDNNDQEKRANKRPRLGEDAEETQGVDGVTECMDDFVKLLEDEIKKFNVFFMDKEEEYIIRFRMLKEEAVEAKNSKEGLMKVGRQLVDFHGEMILLENYSALNYTGLLKILKKYDKRSGELIRLPFIQKVLQEPFFRTDVLNKLVKECEKMINRIFSRHDQMSPSSEDTDRKEVNSDEPIVSGEQEKRLRVPEELEEIKHMENMYLKLTISALRTMKEIRSGSSTVNVFSLPPMRGNEFNEPGK